MGQTCMELFSDVLRGIFFTANIAIRRVNKKGKKGGVVSTYVSN